MKEGGNDMWWDRMGLPIIVDHIVLARIRIEREGEAVGRSTGVMCMSCVRPKAGDKWNSFVVARIDDAAYN